MMGNAMANGTESCEKRYIGLTGSIGSGKSTVARFFGELGCCVLDADKISREALVPGNPCFDKTVSHFGKDILNEDGTVNRARLAAIVFADSSEREVLNGIIHPYVKESMLFSAANAPKDKPVIFDVPLLFESRMERMTDFNICVVSEEKNIINRVICRDNTDAESVRARMRSQMPQREKVIRADAVIINNGTVEELFAQTRVMYRWLTERAGLRP